MRAFFDIGVADATSIWLAQFSGGAIHVIDYIEGSGQPLAYYVNGSDRVAMRRLGVFCRMTG